MKYILFCTLSFLSLNTLALSHTFIYSDKDLFFTNEGEELRTEYLYVGRDMDIHDTTLRMALKNTLVENKRSSRSLYKNDSDFYFGVREDFKLFGVSFEKSTEIKPTSYIDKIELNKVETNEISIDFKFKKLNHSIGLYQEKDYTGTQNYLKSEIKNKDFKIKTLINNKGLSVKFEINYSF